MTSRSQYERFEDLDARLLVFERRNGALPGISDPECRRTFIQQMISSLRRIEFVRAIDQRFISPRRRDPHDPLFDPLKFSILLRNSGKIDEAIWIIFFATHFGKHLYDGWKLAANIYGSFGSGPNWTLDHYKKNSRNFREFLNENRASLADPLIAGRYSNHRQYQSRKPEVLTAVFSTFFDWQCAEGSLSHRVRAAHREHGQEPTKTFDTLYHSLEIYGFGRLGKFDFLTMLGKLGLAPIEPPSTYLVGATGPLSGAKLFFFGDRQHRASAKELESLANRLDDDLCIGKQAIEDSLCNWQKSPHRLVLFRG